MPLGVAKIGLFGGLAEAPYEGTNVSADLLWHLKKVPVSANSTTYDITTSNGVITGATINNDGSGYAASEVITIAGTAVGGLTPDQDITIKVETISGASSPIPTSPVSVTVTT